MISQQISSPNSHTQNMRQLKILQKLYRIVVENIHKWPKYFYFCNQRADIQFAQEDE